MFGPQAALATEHVRGGGFVFDTEFAIMVSAASEKLPPADGVTERLQGE